MLHNTSAAFPSRTRVPSKLAIRTSLDGSNVILASYYPQCWRLIIACLTSFLLGMAFPRTVLTNSEHLAFCGVLVGFQSGWCSPTTDKVMFNLRCDFCSGIDRLRYVNHHDRDCGMPIVPVDRNVVVGSSNWNILRSTRSLVRQAASVVLQYYKSGDISNSTDCNLIAYQLTKYDNDIPTKSRSWSIKARQHKVTWIGNDIIDG